MIQALRVTFGILASYALIGILFNVYVFIESGKEMSIAKRNVLGILTIFFSNIIAGILILIDRDNTPVTTKEETLG